MLGMGATVTTSHLKQARKSPKPFLIGFASQYGIMPLLAFILAFVFDLSDPVDIGLILVGCTPGGVCT